jgi:hypothetical protein
MGSALSEQVGTFNVKAFNTISATHAHAVLALAADHLLVQKSVGALFR